MLRRGLVLLILVFLRRAAWFGTTGVAAAETATAAFNAAAEAAEEAGEEGEDYKGADYYDDYDGPFAVCLAHAAIPTREGVSRVSQRAGSIARVE